MDYSIFDAIQAGFNKVVFVIRKDLEKDFKEIIGNRIAEKILVEYAFQEIENVPEQYKDKFPNRKKPWGTGQAILCCKGLIHEPFLVINADDYYGKQAYVEAYKQLTDLREKTDKLQVCMVGFVLENTLSENGGVTRGICQIDENGMLTGIQETSNIIKTEDGAAILKDNTEVPVDVMSPVSMNMWGLLPGIFDILEDGFSVFLEKLEFDNQKGEYLLPTIIGELLMKDVIKVKVLKSCDRWFGVTYKEDKENVVHEIQKLIYAGLYH